jgi:predicted tellurium resistance membrane protein TerC
MRRPIRANAPSRRHADPAVEQTREQRREQALEQALEQEEKQMEWLTDPSAWIALATLTALELVLGIDNIVFISILAGRLPQQQRQRARRSGLLLAMGMRIALLFSIAWITRMTHPVFTLFGHVVSARDLVLVGGGLFLIAKSTHEIHEKLEGDPEHARAAAAATMAQVLVQITLLDVVFSLDSVITAVGMVQHVEIMIAAVVLSVLLMMWFAQPVGEFVEAHPTVKMLALSFLLLIGMTLVADGVGFHIPKGYVYFAMGFSVFVEMLNLKLRRRPSAPVHLHRRYPRVADYGDIH